jgi:hypothetical protein
VKRIISFSLYGSDPRYTWGAVRQARLAAIHYPGWICRFYLPESDWSGASAHSPHVLDLIMMGAELRSGDTSIPNMFWRFMVADDPEVERFIVRDCDSRIDAREAAAVQQWINEDTILHVMRDHWAHQVMPGGLWGAMWHRHPGWAAPSMERLVHEFLEKHKGIQADAYQVDQDFLARCVWPWAKASATVHDSAPGRRNEIGGKSFPTKRGENWPRFCGEVFLIGENGEDVPRGGDFEQVAKDEE